MFAFYIYFNKDSNNIVITHLPLKEHVIKERGYIKIIMMENSDIKAVEVALKSFLGGVELVNEYSGGKKIEISIVPELKGVLDGNVYEALLGICSSFPDKNKSKINENNIKTFMENSLSIN